MKNALCIWLCLFGGSALAQSPNVPATFLGKWASSAAACKRTGESTLTITETAVRAANVSGFINVGWTPGRKSLEVVFNPIGGGPHQLAVRTYTLSSDGKTLYELNGSEIVASRLKCGDSASK